MHGDTTTALALALASFYDRSRGARGGGPAIGKPVLPFPEEMNRRLISSLSTWHYAPPKATEQTSSRKASIRIASG
ncbi:MAG: UDP-N-acetylglucosamine 2-epimerase [Eggerthella lenta]